MINDMSNNDELIIKLAAIWNSLDSNSTEQDLWVKLRPYIDIVCSGSCDFMASPYLLDLMRLSPNQLVRYYTDHLKVAKDLLRLFLSNSCIGSRVNRDDCDKFYLLTYYPAAVMNWKASNPSVPMSDMPQPKTLVKKKRDRSKCSVGPALTPGRSRIKVQKVVSPSIKSAATPVKTMNRSSDVSSDVNIPTSAGSSSVNIPNSSVIKLPVVRYKPTDVKLPKVDSSIMLKKRAKALVENRLKSILKKPGSRNTCRNVRFNFDNEQTFLNRKRNRVNVWTDKYTDLMTRYNECKMKLMTTKSDDCRYIDTLFSSVYNLIKQYHTEELKNEIDLNHTINVTLRTLEEQVE